MSIDLTSFFTSQETIEEIDGTKKTIKPAIFEQSESTTSTPLEDKYGQDLWIRTKQCWCPDDAETDCRFHSEKLPGWEVCPHKPPEYSKVKGRWLWAHNPNYGKPPIAPLETE